MAGHSLRPSAAIAVGPAVLAGVLLQGVFSGDPAVAMTQGTRLEFEVATVRPLRPGVPNTGVPNPGARFGCRGVDGTVAPEGAAPTDNIPQGRCVGDISLQQLIAVSYGTQRRYVTGGPPWMREQSFQLYHIEAKATEPAKATADELRQMLQSLLANSFKVAIHRESQKSQEYVLRVVRKMVPSSSPQPVRKRPHVSPHLTGPAEHHDPWEVRNREVRDVPKLNCRLSRT